MGLFNNKSKKKNNCNIDTTSDDELSVKDLDADNYQSVDNKYHPKTLELSAAINVNLIEAQKDEEITVSLTDDLDGNELKRAFDIKNKYGVLEIIQIESTKNRTLNIYYQKGFKKVKISGSCSVTQGYESIASNIEISGSANLHLSSLVISENLKINTSGSSYLNIRSLEAQKPLMLGTEIRYDIDVVTSGISNTTVVEMNDISINQFNIDCSGNSFFMIENSHIDNPIQKLSATTKGSSEISLEYSKIKKGIFNTSGSSSIRFDETQFGRFEAKGSSDISGRCFTVESSKKSGASSIRV